METEVVVSVSLASSTRRHCAKLRSSSVSHLEDAGKLGRKTLCRCENDPSQNVRLTTYAAMSAMPTVIVPSIMNNHLHPEIPCAPSRFPNTPAASNPPNILAIELPA
jgi:hypothetical protein